MQNSIYKIKYLVLLSWDWEAWCLTVWGGVIPPSPQRNTAWNKGRKWFHCLGAPNNLIRPWWWLYLRDSQLSRSPLQAHRTVIPGADLNGQLTSRFELENNRLIHEHYRHLYIYITTYSPLGYDVISHAYWAASYQWYRGNFTKPISGLKHPVPLYSYYPPTAFSPYLLTSLLIYLLIYLFTYLFTYILT